MRSRRAASPRDCRKDAAGRAAGILNVPATHYHPERDGAHVALHHFDERLSRLGFAGSDFTLMPSRFEPCGLRQMIGAIYGSLPVVHDSGGPHDTVTHIRVDAEAGNGFVFEHYDSAGLRWAMEEALAFYRQSPEVRHRQAGSVMEESASRFNHEATAKAYLNLYQHLLDGPIVAPTPQRAPLIRRETPQAPDTAHASEGDPRAVAPAPSGSMT